MRSFLAGLLLAIAVLISPPPVSAATITTSEAQETVASLGCSATVRSITSSEFNGYYRPDNHSITLIGLENLPLSWQRFVLLHETGHCLQFQDDSWQTIRARGPHELEWDADAYAIKKYGELYGGDGAEVMHEIWAWVHQEYGAKGNDSGPHGTYVDRITRGNLNRTTPRLEAV